MFAEFCRLPFLKAIAFINFGCLLRTVFVVGFLALSLYDNNDGDLKLHFKNYKEQIIIQKKAF
jgi:hypothetical protein